MGNKTAVMKLKPNLKEILKVVKVRNIRWKAGDIFIIKNPNKYLEPTYGIVTNEGDAIMLVSIARSCEITRTTKIPRAAKRINDPMKRIIDFKLKLFFVTVGVSLGIQNVKIRL